MSLSVQNYASDPVDAICLNTPLNGMDSLQSLPLGDVAKENCFLFAWTNAESMAKVISLGTSWGFTYQTVVRALDMSVPQEEGKRPRVFHQPPWWGETSDITRSCCEYLLAFTKGDVGPLMRTGKLAHKTFPYAVVSSLEMGKKSSKLMKPAAGCPPELFFQRPLCVLEDLRKMLQPGTRMLELYGDSARDACGTLTPCLPRGGLPALDGVEGVVGSAKIALAPLGKVKLRAMLQALKKKENSEEVKGLLADFYSSLEEDEASTMAGDDEARGILLAVGDYQLRNFPDKKKKRRAAKDDSAPKAKHGIAAPGPISDDMLAFLGMEKGTEIARTQVVKLVNDYVKEQGLKNGKFIVMDDKLRTILEPEDESTVTYFSLCTLLARHFPKSKKKKT
ncbi:unnamed protein product, partial [Chrysoparadoxa australica]